MKGIRSKVYPREGGIHDFQTPFIVQKHGEETNPRDEMLLANRRNFSSLEFVNSQHSDYNRCTNVPFVY
jgi:hypothetical protein